MSASSWVRHLPDPPQHGLSLRIGGQLRQVQGGHGNHDNEIAPEASVAIDLGSAPLDYSTEAQVGTEQNGAFYPLFTGHVVRAYPSGGWLHIEARGARALAEAELPFVGASNVPVSELLRTVVEERGGRMRVQGAPDPSPEYDVFCVQAAVVGLKAAEPIRLGSVWLEPQPFVPDAWAEFKSLLGGGFQCVASAYVVARTMVAAERRGLAMIDSALDVVTTTNLYSYGEMPDGRVYKYERGFTLARAERPDAVLVRGIRSQRNWLRELTPSTYGAKQELAGFEERWASAMEVPIPQKLLWAMGALRRAADQSESPIQRNQILWVALEFYASTVTVPHIVPKSSLKRAREAINSLGMPDEQSNRLIEQLNRANEPPLLTKIVSQAEQDGAALSADERELLRHLRDLRNDSQHGRGEVSVSPHDLSRGVALVARMLVFRWLNASSH